MTTALLLIDVQRNMLEGELPVPSAAEVRAALESLLQRAREAGAPVVHVHNDGDPGDPDEPGVFGWELLFTTDPGEIVVRKGIPDAFAANKDLAETLKQQGVNRVVVAGMQSEFCVNATSLGALKRDFEVILASGAHTTYDGKVDAAARARQVEEELAKRAPRYKKDMRSSLCKAVVAFAVAKAPRRCRR